MLRRGLGNKAHHKPVTAHSARAASLNAFGGFLVSTLGCVSVGACEVRLWRQAAQTIWILDAIMASTLGIMNVDAGGSFCIGRLTKKTSRPFGRSDDGTVDL